jgi:ferritin-like metal-binding protein YciE
MKTKSTKETTSKKEEEKNKSKNSVRHTMPSSVLMELFEASLKDIYWAEKTLTKAIPKMIKNASSKELIAALENHLKETEQHVLRVEQVFHAINIKATAKKCEAMAGLVKEAKQIMKESVKGAMRDAGIIAAGQKVEHYEIATYGTLRQFAATLKLDKAVQLLTATLTEEKAADEKLSEVAVFAVNIDAVETKKSSKTKK